MRVGWAACVSPLCVADQGRAGSGSHRAGLDRSHVHQSQLALHNVFNRLSCKQTSLNFAGQQGRRTAGPSNALTLVECWNASSLPMRHPLIYSFQKGETGVWRSSSRFRSRAVSRVGGMSVLTLLVLGVAFRGLHGDADAEAASCRHPGEHEANRHGAAGSSVAARQRGGHSDGGLRGHTQDSTGTPSLSAAASLLHSNGISRTRFV